MTDDVILPGTGEAIAADVIGNVFYQRVKISAGADGSATDVSSANGFELSQGDLILLQVSNLSNLWFDAATSGDKLCWLKA